MIRSKLPWATARNARQYATIQSLRINADRLWNTLHESCQWGAAGEGMNRLSLNDDDKSVREWFRKQTIDLGCATKVDAMGNMFAIYGDPNGPPPVAIGSHLDTQPAGGRYDGILGVMAGLEALRTIAENHFKPKHPLAVVNWTNEEGARFPMSMCASGVWSGRVPLEECHNLKDLQGKSMKEELERIAFLGDTPASHKSNPLSAHFELHIEQGPLLESSKKEIGLVQGVQGMRWFNIELQGKESHTGTTPMGLRSDALLAASRMILTSHEIGNSESGLASTGVIVSTPQSTNTIPGNVRFSLDLRHPEADSLDAMEKKSFDAFQRIAKDSGVQLRITPSSHSPPIKFDKTARECVAQAASDTVGDSAMPLTSGACHDSVYTSYICPTTMVMVPCRDGISHNPRESITKQQAFNGAQVLMNAVLRYDSL